MLNIQAIVTSNNNDSIIQVSLNSSGINTNRNVIRYHDILLK